MGMELLMARARLNHLAAGITPIASAADWVGHTFAAGTLQGTCQANLPVGCLAGDTAVITCCGSADSGQTVTWGVPVNNGVAIAPSTPIGNNAYTVVMCTLQQADIDAGTVGLPFTVSGGTSVAGDATVQVYRARLGVAVEATGAVVTGSFSSSPVSIAVPGLTTIRDNTYLQYAVVTDNASGTQTVNPPNGWTASTYLSSFSGFATAGYSPMAVHGSIDGLALSMTDTVPVGNYAAMMFALRAIKPAITLTAAFPPSLHVGDTVNFDVTAELVDGATGTPTITDDVLPDGLSLAATVQVDATHYKATCSGTLTTAENVTATFGTTGGSVAATPLVHDFNVQAAGALQLISAQTAIPTSASTTAAKISIANVLAGDQIVVVADFFAGGPSSATITDNGGNTYTQKDVRAHSGVLLAGLATAVADAASLTIKTTPNVATWAQITVYVLRGAPLSFNTADMQTGTQQNVSSPPPLSFTQALATSAFVVTWANINTAPSLDVQSSDPYVTDSDAVNSGGRTTFAHCLFNAPANTTVNWPTPTGGSGLIAGALVPFTF